MYRSPCGRRLRSLDEIEQYLQATNCHLAVDNFCCDVELHVHHEFIPVKVKLGPIYIYTINSYVIKV